MRLNEVLTRIESVNNFWVQSTISESALRNAFANIIGVLNNIGAPWALGGGIAAGYHGVPRGTQDVDIFLANENVLQTVLAALPPSYKQIRKHAIEHRDSGVEIELLTSSFLCIDERLVVMALQSAIEPEPGVMILSREGLVALKLQRLSPRDIDDILRIVERGGPIDLSNYPLSASQHRTLDELLTISDQYKLPPDELDYHSV